MFPAAGKGEIRVDRPARIAVEFLVLLVVALLGLPGDVSAGSQTWSPPEPSPEDKDWVRLKSGEWLMGEIQILRDTDFEFDSDELDLLKLDWKDVVELRSPRILTYRFDDLGVFSGSAVMKEGIVAIRTGDKVREFPRERLLLILEGNPSERNFWSAKIGMGFVGRSGNTNQTDLNASLRLRRESPGTRFRIDYVGNVGRIGDEENINNHSSTLALDALVSAGFFIKPVDVNIYNDRFQNIELRTTLSAGAGYDIIRGGDVEWNVGLGGGYLSTKYASVQEGRDEKEGTFAVTPSTSLEVDFTDDVEFTFDYSAQVGVPNLKNTYHHANGVLSVDVLGDILDFDVSATWDRTESPQADAEGNVPNRDDLRISFGLGVEF